MCRVEDLGFGRPPSPTCLLHGSSCGSRLLVHTRERARESERARRDSESERTTRASGTRGEGYAPPPLNQKCDISSPQSHEPGWLGFRRFHVGTLAIYQLGLSQNCYTFALILLIKIVLCSKFH